MKYLSTIRFLFSLFLFLILGCNNHAPLKEINKDTSEAWSKLLKDGEMQVEFNLWNGTAQGINIRLYFKFRNKTIVDYSSNNDLHYNKTLIGDYRFINIINADDELLLATPLHPPIPEYGIKDWNDIKMLINIPTFTLYNGSRYRGTVTINEIGLSDKGAHPMSNTHSATFYISINDSQQTQEGVKNNDINVSNEKSTQQTPIDWNYVLGITEEDKERVLGEMEKERTQNENIKKQEYLITESGVGVFLLGEQIPFKVTNYVIKEEIEYGEEASESPIYIVSKNGQKIFSIYPEYDNNTQQYTNKVGGITIFSGKFKTSEGIGVNSSIKDFIDKYPDFRIWYTYISGMYVIDTKQYNKFQFLLDGKDFIGEVPKMDSDMDLLKLSDFKEDAKINGIRVLGN